MSTWNLKLFKLTQLLTLVFFIAACGRNGINPKPCEGDFLCVRGVRISWSEGSTIKFKLSDTVPPLHRPLIANAFDDYNDGILQDVKLIIDPDKTDAPAYSKDHQKLSKDGVNAIYNITGDWPYEKSHPGSKAITITRYKGVHIVEADIYFKGGEFETTSAADKWIETLTLHELGHVLGRVHSHEKTSIMYPTLNTEHTENGFSESDITAFSLAY